MKIKHYKGKLHTFVEYVKYYADDVAVIIIGIVLVLLFVDTLMSILYS